MGHPRYATNIIQLFPVNFAQTIALIAFLLAVMCELTITKSQEGLLEMR